MWNLRRLWRRLVRSVRVGTADEELHREIASHIKLMEDDYRRRGMAEEQAVLAARRDFGAIEAAKERQRDERAFRWLGDLFQDIAYRLSPGQAIPRICARCRHDGCRRRGDECGGVQCIQRGAAPSA